MKKVIILFIISTFILLSCGQNGNTIQDVTTNNEESLIYINNSSSYVGYESWEEILDDAEYIIKCEITEKSPTHLMGEYTLDDLNQSMNQNADTNSIKSSRAGLAIVTPYTALITDVYYAIDKISDEIVIYQPYGQFGNYVRTQEDLVPLKEGSSYILILGKTYDGDTPIYYLSSIIQGFAEIVTYNEKTSECTFSTTIYNDLFDDITSLDQLKEIIDNAAAIEKWER